VTRPPRLARRAALAIPGGAALLPLLAVLTARPGAPVLCPAEAAEGGAEGPGPELHGPRLLCRSRSFVHLLRVRTRQIADLPDVAGAPTTPLAAILQA
jgi:hypothetical protein